MLTKKSGQILIVVSAILAGIFGNSLQGVAALTSFAKISDKEAVDDKGGYYCKPSPGITYAEYLAEHDITADTLGESISRTGTEYLDSTFPAKSELEFNTLITGDEGKVSYLFNIQKTGYYTIDVTYMPLSDSDKDVKRNLYINGEVPFNEACGIVFERQWEPENKDFLNKTDTDYKAPPQIPKGGTQIKSIDSAEKKVTGPFLFYFEKGDNTITFESVEASMAIEVVSITGSNGLLSYEEYLASHADESKISEESLSNDGLIVVQAENVYSTTSAEIVAMNDRTSPLTIPYHPSNVVLNTIGGDSWQDPGMGITWRIHAPKRGLYRIGARFLQNENKDSYCIRELKIDGKVPFKEAGNLKFSYGSGFQASLFANDEKDAYYFYLKEGINTLSLTVAMDGSAENMENTHYPQPLILDYIFAAGEGAKLPKAEAGFGEMFLHKVKAFIGSFTNEGEGSFGESKN
ncbi:MAG: hypothetical protein K6G06_02700 [Butyrivibrio sp.]|nr:hypothetical protein [Butyrivibrio sp.]